MNFTENNPEVFMDHFMTFMNPSLMSRETWFGEWIDLLYFTLTGQNPDPIGAVLIILISLYAIWYIGTFLIYAGTLIAMLVMLIVRGVKLTKRKIVAKYVWLYIVIATSLIAWGVWAGILSVHILAEYNHVVEYIVAFIATPLYSTLCMLPCLLLCAFSAISPAMREEQNIKRPAISVPACIGMGIFMLLLISELLIISIAPFPVHVERFIVLFVNYGIFTIQLVIFLVGGLIHLINKRRSKHRLAKQNNE